VACVISNIAPNRTPQRWRVVAVLAHSCQVKSLEMRPGEQVKPRKMADQQMTDRMAAAQGNCVRCKRCRNCKRWHPQ